MTMIKKIKMYAFILVGITLPISSSAMGSKKGEIRVFDFKYERFEFLNGTVALELPDKPRQEMTALYYKVLMDYALSWSAGHYEVSIAKITQYKGSKEERFQNKLLIETETTIEKDGSDITRKAIWYGQTQITLRLRTNVTQNTPLTLADRDARIAKDDEIFNHIVESFRYRKEDGTYAKPEIIRQAEEVKEVKHTEAEYQGNGQ